MNCDAFRQHWTDWHEGWLDHDHIAMERHRDTCSACQRFDRQMRRLVGELHARPEEPDWSRQSGAAHAWSSRSRWVALAATLALGIGLGLLLRPEPHRGDSEVVVEPVRIGPGREHSVALTFDSPRMFERVDYIVELPQGFELQGFPGQREIRWQGRLAEGRSRLELPLIVAPDAGDGRLIARIMHDGGERHLVVPLDTAT